MATRSSSWRYSAQTVAAIEIERGNNAEALAAAQDEAPGIWRDSALALVMQKGTDRAAADAALQTLIAKSAAYQVAQVYAAMRMRYSSGWAGPGPPAIPASPFSCPTPSCSATAPIRASPQSVARWACRLRARHPWAQPHWCRRAGRNEEEGACHCSQSGHRADYPWPCESWRAFPRGKCSVYR